MLEQSAREQRKTWRYRRCSFDFPPRRHDVEIEKLIGPCIGIGDECIPSDQQRVCGSDVADTAGQAARDEAGHRARLPQIGDMHDTHRFDLDRAIGNEDGFGELEANERLFDGGQRERRLITINTEERNGREREHGERWTDGKLRPERNLYATD